MRASMGTEPASRRRPGRRSLATALCATVVAGLLASGCTSDPKTPAEQRHDRVQQRIEASFSRSQAACIMKVLDPATIAAIDRTGALPTHGEPLRIYSNALAICAGG